MDLKSEDVTPAEAKATYDMIKKYISDKYETKVSSLYIAQVKRKYGLEIGKNYNISKKDDARVPNCPVDKEKMIVAALKHYQMFPLNSKIM